MLSRYRRGADDDGPLHLEIGRGAAAGDQHLVVGADHRGGILHEDDRLGRDLSSGLLRVIDVVQADAHDLARVGDRRPHPQLTGSREHGKLSTFQRFTGAGEAASGEERTVDVAGDRRQVVDDAVVGTHGGALGPQGPEAKQLHWPSKMTWG